MKKVVCAVALCLASTVASVASASTIQFEGEGKVGVVKIRSDGFPNGVWTYAGELDWAWVGLPADGFSSSWIYTYCIGADDYLQNLQSVSVGPTTGLTMPNVDNAGAKVAWLLDTYAPGIHASGTGTDAAALQVAIWEALYDNDSNLSTGRFQLLDAWDWHVGPRAQVYLTALGSANYQGASAVWLDAPVHGGQDQLALVPVAEPDSLFLLGSGVLGACFWKRRSRLLQRIQSCIRRTSSPAPEDAKSA